MNKIKSTKKILDLESGTVKENSGDNFFLKKHIEKRLVQDLNSGLELGFAIALPLVGGALLGAYLDKILGTTPKVTLSLIFLGVIMSGFYLYKIVKDNVKN